MSTGRIAIRYATPIIDMAEEKKIIDEVKSDMESFIDVCKESRDFALMLKSPTIPHQRKGKILKKIFEGKVNELTLQFFNIITKKHREDILEAIAEEFLRLYNLKNGLTKVSITTSFKLDELTKKKFEKLAKKVTGKQPILKEKIDPNIIGGYILKLDGQQIDESISNQLKNLKLKFQ